ncbi:translation initiation factor IF-2-like [Amphibalanus amphitrite]|uniref:translation initiation factor IF-2-like n=1 Tax=Amphibalanus amphitrite TaxID=1232801 RepID=UPI001C917AB8|nr:translation initiation factor IF-2-like [Amphibalanus amphitrite]
MEDVGEQSQSQVVLDGIDASQLDVVFEDSQASNSQASNASSPADAEVTAAVGNGQPGTVAANRSGAATEAAARPEPDRRPVGSQPATLERPPARPQQRSPTPGPSGAPDVRRPGPSLATPRRPQPSKRTPAVAGASQQSWQRELVDCWKQAKATEKDRVSCFLEYLGTLMRNVAPDDLDDVEDKVLRVVRSFR